jgi:hypothetical protein
MRPNAEFENAYPVCSSRLGGRLWAITLAVALLAWFFADTLFGSGMFAFRDAAHFYYPLFQFTRDEWAAGRVPLWNPYENLGMPLAGNPAASVFYPGKLVFALPISYPWAYKIYIMAHLLLAALAAYRLARHWQASVEAAGLCAVSYAFSGNVLFTYCNVVFLVGAAWLPLGMLAADRMLTEGLGARGEGRRARDEGLRVRHEAPGIRGHRSARVRWAVLFGVVLALMVLGGDPQMAYNAGLLAALYALWLWRNENPLSLWERARVRAKHSLLATPNTPHPSPLTPHPSPLAPHPSPLPRGEGVWARVLTSRPVLLALSAAVGLVLSAVQVLPSTEFTRLSDRAPGRIGDRLLGRVEAGTHTEYTYDFSVGPWRLAEYVWPNFSGRQFPVHRRWLEVIPAEARIWTPSLYMGLLPMLLALSAMRFHRREPRRSPPRGSEPRDCWLSWAVVLAVVASFGWYGLGWLAHEINYAAGGDPAGLGLVGDPFGGLYWLMTVALPGYAYFRYPAKLLVVAAMGLSVLAARGFDCVLANPSDRFRRGVLWLGGLSLCGALVALAIRPFWHGWLGGVEADPLFGPLDTSGAASDLLGAFVQTAVLCGLFWWLLRPARSGVRWVPVVALLLSAADLAVANAHLVVTAPADQWQRPSKFAAVLKREEAEGDGQPYRVVRHPIWTPPAFRSTRSPDRLSEAMRWDLDTLWPKYNLADRIPVLGVRGALAPCDFEAFWSLGDWNQTPDALRLPFSLAKYVILPGGKVLTAGGPTDARRPPEGDFRIPDGDGTVLAARESGQSPTRL